MLSAKVVLLILGALALANAELKGVALVFRHGERTPESLGQFYGRTAISDQIGLGQLTLVSNLINN